MQTDYIKSGMKLSSTSTEEIISFVLEHHNLAKSSQKVLYSVISTTLANTITILNRTQLTWLIYSK